MAVAIAAAACDPRQSAYRGGGLEVDTLPVSDMVGVYRAALAGAFTLDDPTLSIMVDPVFLPRTDGLAGGDAMPAELVTALRASRVVQGVCKIPVTASSVPLFCPADKPGYVARFTQPFALPGDTVQVHLVIQQYAIQGGLVEQRLRFERAYYITRNGDAWRAVREARLGKP